MSYGITTSDAADPSKDWWRGAVIYQIYPRSFQDTDGDGIGDLKGIAERLDHVASLNVDAIWISPFFASPMKDFGYDVSDYRAVDPMFGTLEDFDAVIEKAHTLGLKVIIDQVLSHSSDRHAWFEESRQNRDNPKADWYVWADPKPDGTPPNNWLSVFGGPAWQWDSKRRQYYLHNFLASQPDLNFHNPNVREALLGEVRFWLERGVDGLRLDTANFYVHDAELRDNPPLKPFERMEVFASQSDAYNWQDHVYDRNRPETLDFLRQLRALLDEFGATTALGEIGDRVRGAELMGEFTAGSDLLHMSYCFEFLSGPMPTVADVKFTIERFEEASRGGWPCWAFSNHDVIRHATRWAGADAANADALARLAAAILLSLRGSVCLYQGEELGLTEADIAYENIVDPQGLNLWPEGKGRDGCRTPMVWEASDPNAGFSTAKPWLPIPAEHLRRAVDRMEADASSLLHFYRRLINKRKAAPALIRGDFAFVEAGADLLAYRRDHDGETCLCVFNLSGNPAEYQVPNGGQLESIFDDLLGGFCVDSAVKLGAYEGFIGRVT
ncbi:alpha-glucosidase family protein [Fulvimarina sp. MAC8]|uniref:alpha-glucosidase family protein n=1 Tax=Fulvimarina sp. MAC8 TaxID=3162874 RepID=UPI0032F090DB